MDKTYTNTYSSWGVGYWKLAQYIKDKYGPGQKIDLGDYENIKLLYTGSVGNFDEATCSDKFNLVVQTATFSERDCFNNLLKIDSVYSPYKNVKFFIYKPIT